MKTIKAVRTVTLAVVTAAVVGSVSLVPTTSASAASIGQKIADQAVSQIGKAESGNNNYPIAYKINSSIMRPAAWCGIFANWAWYKGGATKRPNMTGSGTAQGHWATYWQKWGKANGRWKAISAKNAAPGDAIVYGNYPDSRHVGVVVAVKKDGAGKVTQVRSVEGNISNKVSDRGWRGIGSLSNAGTKATGFVSPT